MSSKIEEHLCRSMLEEVEENGMEWKCVDSALILLRSI